MLSISTSETPNRKSSKIAGLSLLTICLLASIFTLSGCEKGDSRKIDDETIVEYLKECYYTPDEWDDISVKEAQEEKQDTANQIKVICTSKAENRYIKQTADWTLVFEKVDDEWTGVSNSIGRNKCVTKESGLSMDSHGMLLFFGFVDKSASSSEINDTVYKIQKRVENLSTAAQVFLEEGSNRITVFIPDVTDADAVLAKLGSAGNIYFIHGMGESGVKNIGATLNTETGEYKYELLIPIEQIIANGDLVLDGSGISDAQAIVQNDNLKGSEYVVVLSLNDTGRESFKEATEYSYTYYNSADSDGSLRNIIAIVYDNEVVSAPHVISVIPDGTATITGQSSMDEAKILASTIRIGALPLELSALTAYVIDGGVAERIITD